MSELFPTITGILVLIAAIAGIVRGLDVRLVLLVAAFAMGTIAGDPAAILRSFFSTFADEQFVIPICTAMGFAYVLRQSGCDRHLVLLLLEPVRRVRPLLIPGAVAVGFFVNIAVISQASTAVAVGTVLIPLLRSAGIAPVVVGATLLLGASIGGELLNPGAPELQSIVKALNALNYDVDSRSIQPVLAPLLLVQWLVGTALFWWIVRREPLVEPELVTEEIEQVNYFKAVIPLLPLAILMMVGPPLNWFDVPKEWLLNPDPAKPGNYASRLIGATMLLGSAVAVLAAPSKVRLVAKAFFEGAGYAFTNIVSIIVTANCFGTGIKALKLADWIAVLTKADARLVWPLAGGGALLFAVISGSGMASTESLYRFFVQPEADADTNLRIGAVVSIAAAAGRTTSPCAAVVLLCASLVAVKPLELLKRVCLPLVAATILMVTAAMLV